MAGEITVPSLGESVSEATVAKWFKKVGDSVTQDEPLVELETDKVTMEVNAPASGKLKSIAIAEGTTVEVGTLLGNIEVGAAGAKAAPAAAGPKAAIPHPTAAAKAPASGGGSTEMRVTSATETEQKHSGPAARKMLDEAGLPDVKITASNDLDEDTIFEIKAQGAKIDIWGVGTKLITGGEQPALGGVYKLVAREVEGQYLPTIKISGNPEKITTPGIKNVYRIVSRQTGRAEGDLISLVSEESPDGGTIQLFNPTHTFIQKKVKDYEAVPLLKQIFKDGQQVYQVPDLAESRRRHVEGMRLFWPQYLRRLNPEIYPVDLSRRAWDMKMALIKQHMEE